MSKVKNGKTAWNPGFARAYQRFSALYDPLSQGLSGGLIEQAKAVHVAFLRAGSRVLYPGVGSASELPAAVRAGVRVIGVDAAPASVDRARRRLSGAGLAGEILLGDALAHDRPGGYDAVAAHFFLNLYAREDAIAALARLVHQLRSGGQVFVADFAPGESSVQGLARYAYYAPINLAGFCLGLADLHTLHDYEGFFPKVGIELVARRPLGFRFGPALFEVWIGRKR